MAEALLGKRQQRNQSFIELSWHCGCHSTIPSAASCVNHCHYIPQQQLHGWRNMHGKWRLQQLCSHLLRLANKRVAACSSASRACATPNNRLVLRAHISNACALPYLLKLANKLVAASAAPAAHVPHQTTFLQLRAQTSHACLPSLTC
jgi:hypothetical protein